MPALSTPFSSVTLDVKEPFQILIIAKEFSGFSDTSTCM